MVLQALSMSIYQLCTRSLIMMRQVKHPGSSQVGCWNVKTLACGG